MNRKDLNPEASPLAAFGARLRSSREARGWTQAELSTHMGISGGHISGVETTRKTPSLRFARAADRAFGLLGTTDTFERQWREMHHGSLLDGFPEYVAYEGRAAEIRLYEVGVIPGLLQTPEYTAALVASEAKRGALTPDQAQERVELVAKRQAMLARKSAPEVFVVLDESCLYCPIGDPSVMDAQLARLVHFAEQPNTVLQVAPFALGELRSMTLPAYILTMADRQLMAYAESSMRGYLERDGRFVLPVLRNYHLLQAEAPSQAASVAMINKIRRGSSPC
ncbi:helix-turn-helix domain-containing protein [Streptomyces sp. LE64]|uniref:helix-turn-helix domain-containing protein n=1 Tax=unclassified Streptomyces TaxID=2593676 RepID=UPI003412CE4D